MCNLIAHTPTAAWSGNLTQVGSFHTSRYHARLAEFTPLGATAGWLKLATQAIGASSSRHRHDDPRAAKLARECVRNQGADEHPNQERQEQAPSDACERSRGRRAPTVEERLDDLGFVKRRAAACATLAMSCP